MNPTIRPPELPEGSGGGRLRWLTRPARGVGREQRGSRTSGQPEGRSGAPNSGALAPVANAAGWQNGGCQPDCHWEETPNAAWGKGWRGVFRARLCVGHRDGRGLISAQGVKTTRAGKGTAGGRREKGDAWLASESTRGIHRRMGTATVRDDGRGAHWLEPPLSGVALKVRATWALSTTAICPVNKAGGAQ